MPEWLTDLLGVLFLFIAGYFGLWIVAALGA